MPMEGGKKRGYLSRAEMTEIIRDAQNKCRMEVPISSHRTPAGRSRLGRDKNAYLDCLRRTIVAEVKARLQAKGYKVA